jgi:methyltransferase (TIGR00027 family)
MQEARPSRTAMRVAVRRASHQLVDRPLVFDDPLALKIIGAEAEQKLREGHRAEQRRFARSLRAFLSVRSRVAEDALRRAVGRGTAQYIVLGAGLDTFAYRNPFPALRVFEVDYPATHEWKRRKLAAAAIEVPASLTFAPVDFERQTLAEGLASAGFDRHAPGFFAWLGVTMYLTEDAIASTLAFIAGTSPGGGLVFDYATPRSSLSFMQRLAFDALALKVASAGEPFRTFFDPADLRARLTRAGFHSIVDLGRDELNARYFQGRTDNLCVEGGMARMVDAEV